MKLYRIDGEKDETSEIEVGTFLGNGTEASVDGLRASVAISEPRGFGWRPNGDLVFSEFGGNRMQNVTRCDIGGYHCSSKSDNPDCMHAPGRTYSSINNCQCGCDTFYEMSSGHRIRVLTAGGKVETIAGTGIRGYRNGPALGAEFNHP